MADEMVVMHSTPVWLPQTQTWMYGQVSGLPDGVESHVVCQETANLDQFPVQRIHTPSELPSWRRLVDRSLRRLRLRRHSGLLADSVRRYRADIVHSHFGDVGWCDRKALSGSGARHVVTFYGLDVNYLPRRNAKWLTRYPELFISCDMILCEGPHMAQCIRNLGCPPEKVSVLHLGVSVREIAFRPRSWDGREALRFLIAASFIEKKGIPYALRALGRLRRQGVAIEVALIGDAPSGERGTKEKEEILATLREEGLEDCCRLLGYQPHAVLFAEAYRSHIFISPSVTAADGDTEGGAPVGLIEMMATGMPVLSTTHCDIPEVVVDGESGLLAGERDVDGLVRHLEWLVAHPERWRELEISARERVEMEFDVILQAGRLAAVYRSLAGKG